MKSGKRKRIEIDARRRIKDEKKARAMRSDPRPIKVPAEVGTAPCNPEFLAVYNSYGSPKFVERGYYVDQPSFVSGVAVRKCGAQRSRSGGTK